MISIGRAAWFSLLPWWQQGLLILLSYVIVSAIGVLFVAPTGPGSSRILFVILLVYSCLLGLVNSKTARMCALIVAIVSLAAVILSTKAKKDFARKMQEKIQQISVSHR